MKVGDLVMYVNQHSNKAKRYGLIVEKDYGSYKCVRVAWNSTNRKTKIGWYRVERLIKIE